MLNIDFIFKKQTQVFALFILSFLPSSVFAQQWGDYTLYSTTNGTTAILVDTNGSTYKSWTNLTGSTAYASYLLPGGVLLRTIKSGSLSGGGMTGRVQKVDWSGNITWDYTHASSTYNLHHDICAMPNGNILMISYEVKTAAEATAAGSSQSISIWSEKIIEVKPNGLNGGDIVWEWHLWDHLVQNTDASKANYQSSIINHPELLNINYKTTKDWIHMNGIDYNPTLDQIVVSSHNLNEVYVIDHSTTTAQAATHAGGNAGKGGDFLYRWGNPAAYGASGTAVLNVVHDAHWVPEGSPGAGNLVAFNNKGTTSNSTIDQIAPPLTDYNYSISPGSAFTPTSYTSRYVTLGSTSNQGSSQQLPNGNMLVCVALSGLIYEISSAGTTLWQMTASGGVAQSSRYSKCYLNASTLSVPTIMADNTTLKSSTASNYQWYLNGKAIANATQQTYTPTSSGIYLVKTSDDCTAQYSKGYSYSVITALEEVALDHIIQIVPNPSQGIVYIKGWDSVNASVTVTDLLGNKIIDGQALQEIDLTGYAAGTYIVTGTSPKGTFAKKINIYK